MRVFVRATAAAAASFVLVAGPSFAWETGEAPVTARYSDHASAGLAGSELALNSVEVPAFIEYDTDFSTPLDEHVEATVSSETEPVGAENASPAEEQPVRQTLAELVSLHMRADAPNGEHDCLAGAVYFESKGEPLQGQLAVAEVVINRARSGRFPKSLCGVIKQRGQFSFIRGGRFPAIARSSLAWKKAVAIAHIALNDLAQGAAPDALFFHAKYVSPGWKRVKRVATVGNHIFYR
jgi:N-acetylmuramoyl-L-alanine amidase